MSLLKTILCISFLLVLPGLLTAADTGTGKLGVVKKSQFPGDENDNVLRRMQSSGFDFSKPHDVEFFAVFRTEAMADSVARQYVADSKAGDKIKRIDTKPAIRGGMELRLVKTMFVTYDNITSFERNLAARVAKHDGYLDGWGVLQQ